MASILPLAGHLAIVLPQRGMLLQRQLPNPLLRYHLGEVHAIGFVEQRVALLPPQQP